MNLKSIILLILFITSGTLYYQFTDTPPSLETYEIQKIIDGDTLELSTGERVRLKGINTPESSMPYYTEAKTFLQSIVQNKLIQIENHGTDKYGRILAHIFINNRNVNAQILEQGLATLYYYESDSHYDELKEAEEFARQNQKGLWQKSTNAHCIKLVQLKTDEPELLILQNKCNKQLNIIFKDDATHIYHETINPNSFLTKTFSHIWNTDGDSIYIRDSEGLLIFHRYN